MQLTFPLDSCGMIFRDPYAHVVFCGVLALIGLWGLWTGWKREGWPGLLPWDVPGSTHGMEDEALTCVLANPSSQWKPEVLYVAGQAAIRRLRGNQ